MKRAVYTIVAKNYLAHARALMESIRTYDPDLLQVVILVDEPDGYFDPALEPYSVILASELPVEEPRWFRFKYTVLELSTALKPYAARLLFDRFELDSVVYLDPDILLFRSMEAVFEQLDRCTILLTPHLIDAIPSDGRRPDEIDVLRTGVYNLGFLGLTRSPLCDEFLAWWSARLADQCVSSPRDGLFVDQRWMDLAPGLFEGVGIVRDPSWNVAYWNLHSRGVRRDGERYLVDETPLLFFHFSGYDPAAPTSLSKYQDRFDETQLGDTARLLELYRSQLIAHGWEESRTWPYTWGRFEDGEPVPDFLRPVYRQDPNIVDEIRDPFSDDAKGAIHEAWNKAAPVSDSDLDRQSKLGDWIRDAIRAEPEHRISRAALAFWESAPDGVAALGFTVKPNLGRYYSWLLSHGVTGRGLTAEALENLREERRRWKRGAGLLKRFDAVLWRIPLRLRG